MLLDEWHLEVETPSSVSSADAEAVRSIVSELLESFRQRVEASLRASTGIAGLEVRISQ